MFIVLTGRNGNDIVFNTNEIAVLDWNKEDKCTEVRIAGTDDDFYVRETPIQIYEKIKKIPKTDFMKKV